MKSNNELDDFLTQLFQAQQECEQEKTPSFASIYGKAKTEFIKMRNTKWLIIAVIVSLVTLGGFAYSSYQHNQSTEKAPTLKAGTSLYQQLMRDGKIVTNEIYFEFDRAAIKSESMGIIKAIADMLEEHPDVRLSIHGHTDNLGASSYNLQLSDARAAAVKQALIDFSIEGKRLSHKGLGESNPTASNNTEQGRALNRRVEFVLVK